MNRVASARSRSPPLSLLEPTLLLASPPHGPLHAAPSTRLWLLALLFVCLSGCAELRARSHARAGNDHFRNGDYQAALREFELAEQSYDGLPVIALNKGLTCRQLILAGSRSEASQRAVDCALAAFERLQKLAPSDPRGEQLYVQTLFDGDRYDALTAMYEGQLRSRPDDLLAINGLIQVHSRANRPEQALAWTLKRADLLRSDAEAQYAAGVAIYAQLFQRGGGPDKATYDPRLAAEQAQKNKAGGRAAKETGHAPERPLFGLRDIAGPKRASLADSGISYLERALALRPTYREALVYLNLLYRQRSFAFFDQPAEWQRCVDAAEGYRMKAIALEGAARAAAK